MVFATETAPAASIYATRTAVRAALAGMQPSEADAADAGDAVLVTVHNLSFETKRDGLAEHLGVAEHRVEVLMRPDGRSSGRARVCLPSPAQAPARSAKGHPTHHAGRPK